MAKKRRGNPNWTKGVSGNPSGKPKTALARVDNGPTILPEKPTDARMDGWYSMISGIGNSTYDKREGVIFNPPRIISQIEAQNLWRGNDIAARIIEIRPKQMLRAGFELCIADDDTKVEDVKPKAAPGLEGAAGAKPNPFGTKAGAAKPNPFKKDLVETGAPEGVTETEGPSDTDGAQGGKDLAEDIQGRWEELNLEQTLFRAFCYENAYGGAAIIMGAIDGSDNWEQPLDEKTVREFKFLTLLEPQQVVPEAWYLNPLEAKYGEVEIYRINPRTRGGGVNSGGEVYAGTTLVHESRMLIFPGITVSVDQVGELSGWGDSTLTRIWQVLRDFGLTWESASILMNDFAQAVYKIKDLNQLFQADDSTALKVRMQMVELMRSTARAVLIDSEEEFERKATPITGLPEFLDRFERRLTTAAGIPLTLLIGTSPGGLNATGESDTRQFYDDISSEQRQRLLPMIERVVRLLFRAAGKPEPQNWSIEFRPLWQPTDKEKAETRKLVAETDAIYIGSSVYSPEECAVSRFGGDKYSSEMTIDFTAREAQEPAAAPPAKTEQQLQEESLDRDLRLKESEAKVGALAAKTLPPKATK